MPRCPGLNWSSSRPHLTCPISSSRRLSIGRSASSWRGIVEAFSEARMSFPQRGKVAVVTGAGRGIGAAIATALSREGAGVALIGRDAARLERQAAELSADALVAPADITDPESVHKAFAKIRERFPRIDILVNNAGQAESAPFSADRKSTRLNSS